MKDIYVKIFEDTERIYQERDTMPVSVKKNKYSLIPHNPKTGCNIYVKNLDCIQETLYLSKSGKTLLLNMASYKRPGGGVRRGAMAQEEEICRRSNLLKSLDTMTYPLSMNEYIYTSNVDVFKDSNYKLIDGGLCDVITIASVNLNGLDRPSNYSEIMQDKIDQIFKSAVDNNCVNVVVSAFGCGVFKNDPDEVSKMFIESINKYMGYFNNICFSILNDRNSNGSNFEIFEKNIKNSFHSK